MRSLTLLIVAAILCIGQALNIVIAGGTGKVGASLASQLHNQQKHEIKILCRNAFLASAPARVSEDFGWLGESFLNKHDSVSLRDWDGGDLLDIVGW